MIRDGNESDSKEPIYQLLEVLPISYERDVLLILVRTVITCTFDRTARIRCPPCSGCSKTVPNSDYNDADSDPRHLLPSIQRLKLRRLLGNSLSHGGDATADVESWNHIPMRGIRGLVQNDAGCSNTAPESVQSMHGMHLGKQGSRWHNIG